jgi:hypothetical protein
VLECRHYHVRQIIDPSIDMIRQIQIRRRVEQNLASDFT